MARSKPSWLGQTVTRETLSDAVQRAVGLSGAQSKTLVSRVLEEIAATLERGETVKLSSFGSFVLHQKRAPWPQS
jgi:integration host factor subunit alpha